MKAKMVSLPEKKLVGMHSKVRHQDHAHIAMLWQRFMPNHKRIKNRTTQDFIAVQHYSDFNDFDKPYTIWAAIEVSDAGALPEGMAALIIPAGDYAVFRHKGMNAPETYQRIMTEWLPSSGYAIDTRPHFQVMGKDYKNGSEDSEEDFYVPVRLK